MDLQTLTVLEFDDNIISKGVEKYWIELGLSPTLSNSDEEELKKLSFKIFIDMGWIGTIKKQGDHFF